MTAKELINELQALVKKHGDNDVFFCGFDVTDAYYNAADGSINLD